MTISLVMDDLGPAHLMDRALTLVQGPWESLDVVRWIGTASILAEAWKPARLERCRALLAAGHRAPPVSLVGHRLGRRTFYTVSDGNHRVIAAREINRRVKAKIGGIYAAQPEAHLLWQGTLWRREGNRLTMVSEVPEVLVPYLLKIGVTRGEP